MKKEYYFEDRVMGCELSVSLITEREPHAKASFARMLRIARAYDTQFSRFIEDSELSTLNRTRAMRVSYECLAVLKLGRELYRKTDKAFNPLVDISRYGYDADISVVKGRERSGKDATTPYNIDFSSVRLDEVTNSVSLLEGQAIDVGGYLKGYVAEMMAREAGRATGVIVNLGGDIYTEGKDASGRPFRFEIENPLAEDKTISFAYADGGIATSGSYRRTWSHGGVPFHHILDGSGRKNPHTDIVSATVLAKRGHEAEAYATAAIVLGSENAGILLASRGADYCFIRTDGSVEASPRFSALARA